MVWQVSTVCARILSYLLFSMRSRGRVWKASDGQEYRWVLCADNLEVSLLIDVPNNLN